MSIAPTAFKVAIPLLAAGAAIAVFSFVSAKREPRVARLPGSSANAASPRIALTRTAAPQVREPLDEVPHNVVLPLAFWDSAVEDPEDDLELPISSYRYDAVDEASSGARWLARATQGLNGDEFDEFDDPAEIAADSMSMISEASRSAAALNSLEDDDTLEDDDRV